MTFARWLFGCSHPSTYRERRPTATVDRPVLHFVCESCGAAWPAMNRTDDEHRDALDAGRVLALTPRRVPTLMEFNTGRDRSIRREALGADRRKGGQA